MDTPFAHFFVIAKKMIIETTTVREILDSYEVDHNTFNIFGTKIPLFSDEAALILGLPSVGKSFRFERKELKSKFLDKYLEKHRHDRHNLLLAAKDAIEEKDSVNAARLLLLFLFSTILFPGSGNKCPGVLWSIVDNFDDLWKYKWGDQVMQYMIDGLKDYHTAKKKKGNKCITIHGCVVLLVVRLQ